ncbi:MAG: hypothetical protein JWQ72_3277 [Polaromonas sp.]|nr:hypothetical protein [Polaromonas sp.]
MASAITHVPHTEELALRLLGDSARKITRLHVLPGPQPVAPERMAAAINRVLHQLQTGQGELTTYLPGDNSKPR